MNPDSSCVTKFLSNPTFDFHRISSQCQDIYIKYSRTWLFLIINLSPLLVQPVRIVQLLRSIPPLTGEHLLRRLTRHAQCHAIIIWLGIAERILQTDAINLSWVLCDKGVRCPEVVIVIVGQAGIRRDVITRVPQTTLVILIKLCHAVVGESALGHRLFLVGSISVRILTLVREGGRIRVVAQHWFELLQVQFALFIPLLLHIFSVDGVELDFLPLRLPLSLFVFWHIMKRVLLPLFDLKRA